MKKLVSAVLVFVLVLGVMSVTAFAHCGGRGGHRGARYSRRAAYPTCTVENCDIFAVHDHDGVYYAKHWYGDGHHHHEYYLQEDGTYLEHPCYYESGCPRIVY